jgi:hypothetical protein
MTDKDSCKSRRGIFGQKANDTLPRIARKELKEEYKIALNNQTSNVCAVVGSIRLLFLLHW